MASTIQVDKIQDIGGNTMLESNGSGTFTSSLPNDGKILISAQDTTANYLQSKIVQGSGMNITLNGAGSNESITFAATASPVLVSLGTQVGTVDVANVTFDNVFSDTYTRYMMMIDYMLPASANVEMRYNWRKSDSSDQTGGYTYTGLELRQGTTDEFSASSGGATNSGVLTHNIQTGNGEQGVRALFDIYRPGTVDGNATMHYIVGRGTYRSYDNDAVQAAHFYVSSNNYNTTAFTGIKVYFNSGNINSYKIRMYGVVT